VNQIASISPAKEPQIGLALTYILISVLGSAAGQLLLKGGVNSMGTLALSLDQSGSILWRIVTNPLVVAGLAVYAGSTVFWIVALSHVDLSFAYPFASLGYVIMLVASWLLFNEQVSLMRAIGSLVVVLGVVLISRS
jgi:multidrug transporter EmrE-like cation transporter